jgi:hypothetical protein
VKLIFTEEPTTMIVVAVGHRGEIYEGWNNAMTKVQFIRTLMGMNSWCSAARSRSA